MADKRFKTFGEIAAELSSATELVDCELPNGLLVRVKRDIDLEELAFTGQLPVPLLQRVQEMTEGGEEELDINTMLGNMSDFRPMFLAMYNDAIQQVLIDYDGDGNPVFADINPRQQEVIGSKMANVIAVVNKVMEVPSSLETFPEE